MSKSIWMDVILPSFPPLQEDSSADVCIVGAGICGLMCAYTLVKAGKSVIVVDQQAVGSGQTAYTTGHLAWALDDRFYELERLFGEDGAKLAAASHQKAVDYIEKIIQEEQLDCDFERVDGYLFLDPERSLDELQREYCAAKKLNLDVELDAASFDGKAAVRFPNQAHFHIYKYLKGLLSALVRYGVQIYSNTKVVRIREGRVQTASKHTIHAESILVATCTPINNRFMIHTKQAAYRTYVIGAEIPKNHVKKALYWDTGDPYHYVRIQKHDHNQELDWLIIGGEDHKTGQGHPELAFKELETWAREHFPQMGPVRYAWSGQIFEPIDSLAYIGKNPHDKKIYIATGDSGNGLTHAAISSMLIPDLILGRENSWTDLYKPSRKTLQAAPEFIEENSNTLWQYRDWLEPGDAKNVDALKPGEGIVVRDGHKKIAISKDAEGNLHSCNAYCPHLGACLRWNPVETSWDCPAHGSRFDCTGKELNGPTSSDLYKV